MKTEPFGNRTICKTSEIRTFGFQTLTVHIFKILFEICPQADREKEAQRARDEEERARVQKQETAERQLAERQKAEVDRQKERRRNEIVRKLPAEPSATDSRKLARLRFRIPNKKDSESAEEENGGKLLLGQFIAGRFIPTPSSYSFFSFTNSGKQL